MKIRYTNIKEFILFSLAICGEIRVRKAGRAAPCNEKYYLKILSEMREDKIIHSHQYQDRQKFYRVCHPEGENELRNLSIELYRHLGLMVGSEGKRYKGTKEYRLKQRRQFEICALMLNLGIEIDGVELEGAINYLGMNGPNYLSQTFGHSIFNQDGSLKTAGEILKNYNAEDRAFFTSKALKNISTSTTAHSRQQMHRSIGMLLNKGTAYNVYYLNSPYETWFADVESQLAILSRRTIKRYVKDFNDYGQALNTAIFYTAKSDVIIEMLTNNTKKIRIKPNEVYNVAYLVPLDQEPEVITSILLEESWKKKINRVLIPNQSNTNTLEDGWTEEGLPVYNFLCCNVGLLRKSILPIRAKQSVVIIHEWMEPIIKPLLGSEVEVIKISNEQLKVIAAAIGVNG